MIELNNDSLMFRFPEADEDAVCQIDFQRTLRIPDDNQNYPLPPGFGPFPLRRVQDHTARLPSSWYEHGGVLLPMRQAEALWIRFRVSGSFVKYPFAVKIAAGKINAVNGDPWTDSLDQASQDYAVVPTQPWLDGFCVRKGWIRQFVAMPLGEGYSAEEQLTGQAEHGGLQLMVYPMKRRRYLDLVRAKRRRLDAQSEGSWMRFALEEPKMGMAAGGLICQEIYQDQYGIGAWDLDAGQRCFVHLLNSKQWQQATNESVPAGTPTMEDYYDAGLPWYDYYDEKVAALAGSQKLASLDGIEAFAVKRFTSKSIDKLTTKIIHNNF